MWAVSFRRVFRLCQNRISTAIVQILQTDRAVKCSEIEKFLFINGELNFIKNVFLKKLFEPKFSVLPFTANVKNVFVFSCFIINVIIIIIIIVAIIINY